MIEEGPKPPDGGWGWMVVVGSFIVHFIMGGLATGYGLLYIELLEKFQSPAALTAWVGSIMISVGFVLSPVSTALRRRLSVRMLSLMGACLVASGVIMSAFAMNLAFLYFSLGFFTGFGFTLCYTPTLVIVNQYFDKRRPFAMGISASGVGCGAFTLAPLSEWLLEKYGFSGTMLILGGIALHLFVTAALYRPLTSSRSRSRSSQNCEEGGASLLPQKINIPEKMALNVHSGLKEGVKPHDAICEPEASQVLIASTDNQTRENNNNNNNNIQRLQRGCHARCGAVCNIRFLLLAISYALLNVCYGGSLMMVPSLAKEKNIPPSQGAFLLSVIGASDTLARILIGFVFTHKKVVRKRIHINIVIYAVFGLSTISLVQISGFWGLLADCVIHGMMRGAIVSQFPIVLGDYFGVDKVPSIIGLYVAIGGVGTLMGPFIAGLMKDLTGQYGFSFYVTGASPVLASLLMASETVHQACSAPHTKPTTKTVVLTDKTYWSDATQRNT